MRLYIMSFVVALCTSVITAQVTKTSSEKEIERLLDSSSTSYDSGDYVKSLEYNIAIIKKSEEIQSRKYLQKGYRYLGYDYLILEDTVLARYNFEKSHKYARLTKNDTAVGQTFMDLANLYSLTKETYNKSIIYHDKSIAAFKAIKDTINLGTAYYNTIITTNDNDRLLEAYPYLLEIDKLKYALNDNLRVAIQNQWGQYYLEKKNYKKTDYYLSEVLLDSTLQKSDIELVDTYNIYSKSLYSQKRYKEAYDYSIRFQELDHNQIEKEQSEASQKVAASFQLSQYQENIEQSKLKNIFQQEMVASKERINNFLIALVVICILSLSTLFYVLRSRKEYVRNLTRKSKEYLKAKQQSEDLAKSKSAFFSTVSHELRTPLYGVIGLSTILMDDPKLKSHQEDIKSLKFSADYLLALINDVLHINKIDSKRLEDNQAYFNVREFIKNIASSFEYMRLQNHNILNVHISEKVPKIIKGDSTRLSQILMNLIGNASKFTENGTIDITVATVSISDSDVGLKFIIKDSGIGIPKEKQSSIFDEFSQVSSKHYTYQGTGLGLPIVKKLLALSDAEIHVESEEGKGSSFYFTLNFEYSESNVLVDTSPIVDDTILDGKNILIVDDNRINQIVTTKILQKSGVHCRVANNGQEAVDIARDEPFDLILMDINMPVKDGLQATQEIREFNEKIPVIALTAVEVKEMRYKIYNAGLTDIIVKPYDITIFKRTILSNLAISERSDASDQIKLQA